MSFSQKSENSSAASDDNNGQPYDGKIFILAGEVCPDQSNIRSKIILDSATSATLVRDNCQDLTPVALGPNDFTLDSTDSSKLYYHNQTFTTLTISNISATSDATYAYYTYNFTGSVMFHRLFLNTDGDSTTGYTGRGGVGADYIIENGSFRRYSGVNGAWGWTVIKILPVSQTSTSMSMAIPKADIGSPSALKFVVETAADPTGSGGVARSTVLDQAL